MAQATIIIKCSPDEHRIIRLALETYSWAQYEEAQKVRGASKQTFTREREKTLALIDSVSK